MATSFIEFKDYGFWAHDTSVEALIFSIVRELRASPLDDEWKYKIIDQWTFSYLSGFSASVPIELDETLDDDEKITVIVDTLKSIVGKTENDERYLSPDDLNKSFVGGRRRKWVEVNKEDFLQTAKMTIDLLEGRLKTNASSPLTYLKSD
jgi:hypothetical protein